MTLRRRLILALMLLLTGVGIAGGFAAYFIARQEPDNFLDDRLVQVARYIGDAERPVGASDGLSLDPEDAIVIQIWKADGTPVRLSNPDIQIARRTSSGFVDVEASGEMWRSYGLVDPDRTVQISERIRVRDELATNSALRSALPLILLIPLSWLVLGSVIAKILRPLSDLETKVRERAPGSSELLPLTDLPGEVLPVVHAVNDLLQRQHELLQARERFISDAAHQLRTPLTALRIQADNLARATTVETREAMMIDIRGGIMRMSALADQLLALARADQPNARTATTANLADLVKDAVSDALPLADSLGADLGFERLEDVTITCFPEDIRMIVANLIDNALRYGGPRAQVDVETYGEGSKAIVRILDSGPGVPEADLAFIFERFFRSDSQFSEGSGLGLPIAKALASRNGADISLRNATIGTGAIAELVIAV
jgi:two-component system OmpR family sensor kinase